MGSSGTGRDETNLDSILDEVEEDIEKVKRASRNDYDPAALNYPEYFDVNYDSSYSDELSEEELYKNLLAQAIAQERVGFEPETEKYFIDDFNPAHHARDHPMQGEVRMTDAERSKIYQTSVAGRITVGLGGALLGSGLVVGFTFPEYSTLGWVAAAFGLAMVLFGP